MVDTDPNQESKYILTIVPSAYRNNTSLDEDTLESLRGLCYLRANSEDISETRIWKSYIFTKKIINITLKYNGGVGQKTIYSYITNWQNEVPFLNWSQFFNAGLNLVNKSVTLQEEIMVTAPAYFKELSGLIQEVSEETLKDYIYWRTAGYIQETSTAPSVNVEEICTFHIEQIYKEPASALYIRELIPPQLIAAAAGSIEEIRKEFKYFLNALNWTDLDYRVIAEAKSDQIPLLLGYPKSILNKTHVDILYDDLEIIPNNFFQNNVAAYRFKWKNNLKKLHTTIDRYEWDIRPEEPGSLYSPKKDVILIGAIMLQPPFYYFGHPKSLNLATLGFIYAHERAHAFAKYFKNGTAKYEQFAQCIKEQYSNKTIFGYNLDGRLTQAEDIADIVAVQNVFEVCDKLTDADPRLGGFKYNNKKLCYMGFAQMFSVPQDKKTVLQKIARSNHGIGKFRVNVPLSFTTGFAETYQCPIGSNMNPKVKCKLS